jgi:hypothetical protein
MGKPRFSAFVIGVFLVPMPKLLGSIGRVCPLAPMCQIERQIMVEIRERSFKRHDPGMPWEEIT